MVDSNIRWLERLDTYKKALARLTETVLLFKHQPLSPLEKDGMVQRFEYTQELAWKLLKNYIEYQGEEQRLTGSRDVVRRAFAMGLIKDSDTWFDMLDSRNTTSHVYDEKVEVEVLDKIINLYYPILNDLKEAMEEISRQ